MALTSSYFFRVYKFLIHGQQIARKHEQPTSVLSLPEVYVTDVDRSASRIPLHPLNQNQSIRIHGSTNYFTNQLLMYNIHYPQWIAILSFHKHWFIFWCFGQLLVTEVLSTVVISANGLQTVAENFQVSFFSSMTYLLWLFYIHNSVPGFLQLQ